MRRILRTLGRLFYFALAVLIALIVLTFVLGFFRARGGVLGSAAGALENMGSLGH